jgi:hypothetical protein
MMRPDVDSTPETVLPATSPTQRRQAKAIPVLSFTAASDSRANIWQTKGNDSAVSVS